MRAILTIAVPLFADRVSPHFGASAEMLLIEARHGKIVGRRTLRDESQTPAKMARRLVDLGVARLVCGGIQREHKQWLIGNGVEVLDNHKGPAETVIAKILADETFHSPEPNQDRKE